MSKQELTGLLQKYFSKEISPAEQQALARLIAESADEELLKASVEDIWNDYQPEETLPAGSGEEYYQRILAQIKPAQPIRTASTAVEEVTETMPAAAPPLVHRVHFLRRSWVRMAAAAVLVAAIGTAIYLAMPADKPVAPAQPIATVTPERVLTRNITLADGSKVTLQQNSTLEYPKAFTGATREVILRGEAYFDVAHHPKQPFIIHTGAVTTTVLGTAFTIKAWPAEKEIIVTVTRGKVKVENDSKVLGILVPDQQITFNTQNAQSKQEVVNAAEATAWKDQEYTMDGISLQEAIKEMEVRYGTIIELEGKETVGKCEFNATFRQNESLDYVLDVICKIYQAQWTQQAGKIIIKNVNCQ